MTMPSNPYGPRPGGGISLPEYYRPWPAIKNRNTDGTIRQLHKRTP
jgi:ribonuclease Z